MLLGVFSLACNAKAEGWHSAERLVTSPIDGTVHRTVEATLKDAVSGPGIPDPEPVLLAISCENGNLLEQRGQLLRDGHIARRARGLEPAGTAWRYPRHRPRGDLPVERRRPQLGRHARLVLQRPLPLARLAGARPGEVHGLPFLAAGRTAGFSTESAPLEQLTAEASCEG